MPESTESGLSSESGGSSVAAWALAAAGASPSSGLSALVGSSTPSADTTTVRGSAVPVAVLVRLVLLVSASRAGGDGRGAATGSLPSSARRRDRWRWIPPVVARRCELSALVLKLEGSVLVRRRPPWWARQRAGLTGERSSGSGVAGGGPALGGGTRLAGSSDRSTERSMGSGLGGSVVTMSMPNAATATPAATAVPVTVFQRRWWRWLMPTPMTRRGDGRTGSAVRTRERHGDTRT